MASINFNNLKTTVRQASHTFADLALDLRLSDVDTSIPTIGSGKSTRPSDISAAIDLNAIKNSLVNLFNTSPGERMLLPDYGMDIRRHVFEPITELRGFAIGREIKDGIQRWEPRIAVFGIAVEGDPERHEYYIQIDLGVPFISQKLQLQSLINREGFVFI